MINNTVKPLVTNPFLSTVPKTSGTTTPMTAPNSTILTSPTATAPGKYVTQPIPAQANFSGISSGGSSVMPPSSTNLNGLQQNPSGGTTTGSLNGFAIPGQNFQQYEQSQGFPQGGTLNNGVLPSSNQTSSSGLVSSATPVNSNPYTAQAPTYPGLVGAISGISSQPSQNFTQNMNTSQQAQTGLLNTAPANNAEVNQVSQQIAQLKNDFNNQSTANSQGRTNLAEYAGNQGALQNLYSNNLGALEGQLGNVLQGNAQTQAAYTGAGNLANSAAGLSTGQQNAQIGGLTGAAGLSAPQNANALGTYNPVTGQYSQYGGASGGGAASAGAVGTQIQQGGQVQQMIGQQSQAQSLGSNLNQLITQAGINPTANAPLFQSFVSGVNQWLENQSGDPQYQNFANLINEISSRYASILNQSGGTPTDQSTISHSIINGMASGQSIQQVLGSLDKNATDSINALKGASQNNAVSNGQSNTSNSIWSW